MTTRAAVFLLSSSFIHIKYSLFPTSSNGVLDRTAVSSAAGQAQAMDRHQCTLSSAQRRK